MLQEQSLPWCFIPNWDEASVLANIVDANKDEWILGTVAGANTLLVICRDQHVAKLMEDRLLDLMKDK